MVIQFERGSGSITVVPDNIVNIVKSGTTSSEYKYGLVMVSGDIIYINDDEMLECAKALRLRDEQMETLIKNTESIITELTTLNATATSIDGNTEAIKETSASTATNTAGIDAQTKANGTLLSQIKQVCDNIYSWVRSHYAYSN